MRKKITKICGKGVSNYIVDLSVVVVFKAFFLYWMGFIAAFTKEKCHFKTARQLKLELIQSEGLIGCRSRQQLLCAVI